MPCKSRNLQKQKLTTAGEKSAKAGKNPVYR